MNNNTEIDHYACPAWCTDHQYPTEKDRTPGAFRPDWQGFHKVELAGEGEIQVYVSQWLVEVDGEHFSGALERATVNVGECETMDDADQCRKLAACLVKAADLLAAINAEVSK